MNNLNKLPGMDLVSETNQGSFYVDAVSNPNPGFIIMEEWRDIEGWGGFYQVSNMGNVRSLDRTLLVKKPNWNKPMDVRYKGRNFTFKPKKTGYYIASFGKNKAQSYYSVHRLVAHAFIPNPENKPCINHIDSDKTNNHIDNLEWCTYSENMIHSTKNGTHPIGENCHGAKLNEFKVRVIRKCTDLTYQELADLFGLCIATVHNVKNGIIWKHVKSQADHPMQTEIF